MENIELKPSNNSNEEVKEENTREALAEDSGEKEMVQSRITNFSCLGDGNHLQPPIQQVDKDHYLYRVGSTKVHVQTYDAELADEVIDDAGEDELTSGALKFISMLFGMLIVIITAVIKFAGAINNLITAMVEDEYLLTLYVAGFLWTTYYSLKGSIISSNQLKFSKSGQSSNRWLKGVVILFGLAIVLKNGLEFISGMMVDLNQCPDKNVAVAKIFFQALFVVSQVAYLFKFSKVYIRNSNAGSRIGIMIVIAINLSIWIASVVDETLLALNETTATDDGETSTAETSPHFYTNRRKRASPDADSGGNDVCSCHTSFCTTVHTIEAFLFPFLIEFSLVASTLLYITWENVGKQPSPCEEVVRPAYRFYKEYKGAALGGITFCLMVVIIILLGTQVSDTPRSEQNYFTEFQQLLTYEAFLIGLESCMILATLVGFYLYHRIRRPMEHIPMLDQVLLIICIIGPLVANTFSMMAVIAGTDNKLTNWAITFCRPFVEIWQCISQLAFILYGLRREPITSASARETAENLKRGVNEQIQRTSQGDDEDMMTYTNTGYLRRHRDSITSVVSRLTNIQTTPFPDDQSMTFPRVHKFEYFDKKDNEVFEAKPSPKAVIPLPEIVISPSDDDAVDSIGNPSTSSETGTDNLSIPAQAIGMSNDYQRKQAIIKIVSKAKVARPDRLRFRLKDVIMFLLMTNACLWVFLSLNGTAFVVYQYESIFYGVSAWTTIRMICRPLNIFFRMHSAGCLFEMWSFA